MIRDVEIEFDAEDGVNEGTAANLVDDLRDEDEQLAAQAEVLEGVELVDGLSLVALITLAMTTATGAGVLAAFIYKVFRTGVTIVCNDGKVRVKKNKDLPRGSAYIVNCDGRDEYRESLSEQSLTEIITTLIKK